MAYRGPIPQLGLGTYGRTGDAGIAAVLKALELGYRHIDTAQSYDTEKSIGAAIRKSGLKRAEVFVTTKVADTNLDKARFMPSVEKSIETIGVGPVDLLLIHWPSANDQVPFEDYMLALADTQRRGHTRLIGVSNFPIALLKKAEAILGKGAIATNQVEIHPYLQAPKLVAHARSIGLPLTAYRPIAASAVGKDPVLKSIAKAHNVTEAAISLAFLMAEGHIVIPASSRPENLAANLAAISVRLSDADMQAIRKLDRGERQINPTKSPRWDD